VRLRPTQNVVGAGRPPNCSGSHRRAGGRRRKFPVHHESRRKAVGRLPPCRSESRGFRLASLDRHTLRTTLTAPGLARWRSPCSGRGVWRSGFRLRHGLRPILARLSGERGGCADRVRREDRWVLTEAGSRRLAQTAVDGVVDALPKSPQDRVLRGAARTPPNGSASWRMSSARCSLASTRCSRRPSLPRRPTGFPASSHCGLSPKRSAWRPTACTSGAEPDDARAERDERTEPCGSRYSWRDPQWWDPVASDRAAGAAGHATAPKVIGLGAGIVRRSVHYRPRSTRRSSRSRTPSGGASSSAWVGAPRR
jgi:hypothetical protein